MSNLLTINNLISSYGAIKALKGVSLHVEQGELVSLLGSNGAGKSTLLKSIMGLVTIESGEIVFEGASITKLKSYYTVKRGIAIVPEGRKIFPDHTVEANLDIGAISRKRDKCLDKQILDTVYSYFPRLYERRRQMGGTLSGGEQQMLAIGRALMFNPKLLLLDEPSMGLAPLIVEQVFEIISKIQEQGVTILLVEQNARMALQISKRAYVLTTGSITDEDSSANMLQKSTLFEAYLGKNR